jgi:transposase InsO family protein
MRRGLRHSISPPKRGTEGQRERREPELEARLRLGAYADAAHGLGASLAEAAHELGVASSTLGDWARLDERDSLEPKPLGPPARRCDRATRKSVLEVLNERGPTVGLPTLAARFPRVARRELKNLVARYRRASVRGKTIFVQQLRWTEAGTVFAMDYKKPPAPVDGVYDAILSVRDLASHCQLAALPVSGATARSTADALAALFSEHGAPLVMKSDNGSHFTSPEATEVLARFGVIHLLSPPATPSYNGSCEAGIGALSVRVHHESARHGRPGCWTSDDVEAGRESANQTGRPWGSSGPTPSEAWAARRSHDSLRAELAATVARNERELRAERTVNIGRTDDYKTAPLRREAIGRALVAHGLLEVRRRRLRLHIPTHLRANHR